MIDTTLAAVLLAVHAVVAPVPSLAPGTAVRAPAWTVTFGDVQGPPRSEALLCLDRCSPLRWTVDDSRRDQSAPPAVVVVYSRGYAIRARVHRISSRVMLPLFAAETWLGSSLYDHPTSGRRTAHVVVASAIGSLFAVNTVTGVWNLVEARKDPHGSRRRLLHGALMLAADGGFLATALLAPGADGVSGSRPAHRAVALASIATATAGYLVMLLGGR